MVHFSKAVWAYSFYFVCTNEVKDKKSKIMYMSNKSNYLLICLIN